MRDAASHRNHRSGSSRFWDRTSGGQAAGADHGNADEDIEVKEEQKLKLIPVENIPNRKYKSQKNMDIVHEFIDSQLRCALIEGSGTKGLSSNLQEAIKKWA